MVGGVESGPLHFIFCINEMGLGSGKSRFGANAMFVFFSLCFQFSAVFVHPVAPAEFIVAAGQPLRLKSRKVHCMQVLDQAISWAWRSEDY